MYVQPYLPDLIRQLRAIHTETKGGFCRECNVSFPCRSRSVLDEATSVR